MSKVLRLPNVPNVGYATLREKQLSDNIMDFIRQIERDRVRLLTIVLHGREKWRKVAGDIWSGYRISEEEGALNHMFKYFVLLAAQPHQQVELLKAWKNELKYREVERQAMPDIEAERDRLIAMGK